MNSFISWIGGKYLLRKEIYKRFPPKFDKYIEVFGGAAWVLFYKEQEGYEVYNDYNCELVNLFKIVKYHATELQRELQFTLNSRQLFDEMKTRKVDSLTDIQRAARFFLLIDNQSDVQMINTTSKQQAFGVAYAKGILKTLGIEYKPINKLTTEQFITKIKNSVIEQSKRINILPSITFAQAILESQSGNSELAVNANNLFGIKAGNWNGQTYSKLTTEYIDGQFVQILADFRKYNCWEDSIKDHSDFLSKDGYKNLIGEKDYKKVAELLLQDKYATDPDYTGKLINVIEKYNLNQYDIDDCPQYKIDGEKYLRDNSYTLSKHDPLEPVDFGTLGTMLMNYKEKHGIA